MAHIGMVSMIDSGASEKHYTVISSWEYPVLGPLRKGHYRPFYSKIEQTDWRIPDVVSNQFYNDLSPMNDRISSTFNQQHRPGGKITEWLFKLITKLTVRLCFKKLSPAQKRPSWHYSAVNYAFKDQYQKRRNSDTYKEVL